MKSLIPHLNKKGIALLLSLCLLAFAAIGGTIAYLSDTGDTSNTFTIAGVSCEVYENGTLVNHEKTEVKTKDNVTIKNTGDIPAYLRAAVVANWVDKDGNVLGQNPNITVTLGEGWLKAGDYYYYMSAVDPNGFTENLLAGAGIAAPNDVPQGYHLEVQILAEALQAEGGAVTQAWPGVKADADGKLALTEGGE